MTTSYRRRPRGFSLIEVLIAIVVLSFGMLALAAVQGSLFRAGAESKARAIATAFAQRRIEDVRSFGALTAGAVSSYEAISTQAITLPVASGTQFYGCEQVVRYRYNKPTGKFQRLNDVNSSISNAGVVTCADTNVVAAGAVTSGVPDFKEVKVTVGWLGESGVKTVEVADSVAGISPSDAIMLAQQNNAARQGPAVWIRPPNRDANGNIIPEVVPIAISGDEAAASSNPKPTQFVDDVSSATLFSVQSFTGTSGANSQTEVLLNRKIDVAVASCVCSDTGAVSSATNPAYQPTIWNGKQLAYMTPLTAAVGKKIGSAIVSNQNGEISNLCTTCCRDHHDSSTQPLKVDPYRTLSNGAHAHYGYRLQNGNNPYDIAGGLFPVSANDTSNQYLEACRLVRVGGLMRVAVDARQNNLMVTPLNSAGTDFNQSNFISRYSAFVGDYVNYAAQNLPTNYPGPTATYPATPPPGPTSAQLSTYSDIVTPTKITFSAANQTRKMVSFGLYVDYLTPETLAAYNCARTNDNTGPCLGLGNRNALEYIPFYAVNVANLGNNNSLGASEPLAWTSTKPLVVSVTEAQFNNFGVLSGDGGLAQSGSGSDPALVPVGQKINISNSGLTGTAAIDPDDAAAASYVTDAQDYEKTGGTGNPPTNTLTVKLGASTTGVTLNKLGLAYTGCAGSPCTFAVPGTVRLTVSNYTTKQGQTTTNRQVCFPTDVRVYNKVVGGTDGTTNETVSVTIGPLPATTPAYVLTINIVNDPGTCPAGSTLLP